jgi:hypothetical protein
VTNKVSILTDHLAINTHASYFSALFTHHSGINHFEMIEARVLELLHEKINLGSEHVHLFMRKSTLWVRDGVCSTSQL